MTQKIFWQDPYKTELLAQVQTVNHNHVTLDKSIFFAFSGGQESDTGTFNGLKVLQAKKKGKDIEYTLPDNHGFSVGDHVNVHIDWQRRYRLMRLHFAAELVLELFYTRLEGSEKIGAHIAENKARIDFLWNQSISPLLPEMTEKVQSLIDQDLEIITDFSDEINERRYWELKGVAKVACGGTHIKSTKEVGKLRLKRKNIGKGKERVEIYLDS